jgi:CHASE2 domain-containing sensor protein
LVTLAVLLVADLWLERTTVAQRAVLGGFDTASERIQLLDATRTAVVGIGAQEVEKYFGGKRPLPPAALATVVDRLLRVGPRVLVVDIFTDDPAYKDLVAKDSLLYLRQDRLVWAQVLDTATNEAVAVLGGISDPPGRSGLASMLTDEDRLLRKFRPRYSAASAGPGSDTVESLPLAAAEAYVATARDSIRLTRRLPNDTSSIAIRAYRREPPFYLLDDVLAALPSLENAPDNPLAGRALVLGFIDGSDQVLTPRGVRTGSEVVADAIETLLDTRGAIRGFPRWLEWVGKLILALLIAYVHYRLPPRAAAISMIVIGLGVIYAAFWIFEHSGYWTNFILIVVGVWIEQLYENVTHAATPHSIAADVPDAPSSSEA